MDDRTWRYHRLITLDAIRALPPDPSPAAIEEAVYAIRNMLATGSPHDCADGTEVGVIYEHLNL